MPLIHTKMEHKLFDFIKEELKKTGYMVSIVNGMHDHVHCLFGINPQKSITNIIKQIKGRTSHFVNSNNLISKKFIWQLGFEVFGVSHSALDNVCQYIRNQKQHPFASLKLRESKIKNEHSNQNISNSWYYMGLMM